jgi:hypothetical protein
MAMVAKMSKEDYEYQEKIIWNDGRYSFELKKWITLQLINRFREINYCFPYEAPENDEL